MTFSFIASIIWLHARLLVPNYRMPTWEQFKYRAYEVR